MSRPKFFLFFILMLIFSFKKGRCDLISLSTESVVGSKIKFDRINLLVDDSLSMIAKKELQLVESKIGNDTLAIVSANRDFYYPFGRLKDINVFINDKGFKCSLENNKDKTKLYRLTYKNSMLKFLKDMDSGFFELVSGRVEDSGIVLVNAVKIGISKDEFLNKMFQKIIPEMARIKIIIISSAAVGIWHCYTFENEKLTKISFDTDYLYDKK